ncbi:nickel and cobalt resistance protein CnrB [mine drainage metagenome]|uniref:Nickel and cobalt resistance protein CnrB n=1 Tax=mine drainage metagenome TaxID=410659 RepID=A0A1J5SK33_9ZZZZ
MPSLMKLFSVNVIRNSLLVVLFAGVLFGPIFGHAEKQNEAPSTTSALTVTLIQPQQTALPLKIFANGNIAAWQEAIIGSEANGLRVTNVLVNVGDVVKKGQLLADFSAESIEAELNQAKANLSEAEAQGKDAINNAERARTLQNTGAMSNQQIDQYVTAADVAKARIDVAKAAVDLQKIHLKNTKIYAPDSGVISSRSATIGAVVGAGTELFKLIRQSRLEWRAEVISADLPKIKTGMQVNVTVADGSSFKGRVRKVSPTVDLQTRNILVYVDLPANSSAKAGMFAKGEFVLGQSKALTLPQQALVMRDGFTYVFVVKNEDVQKDDDKKMVRQVKVQTGRRIGNLVEIVSGLDAKQQLVATGGAFLSDRDLVKVVSSNVVLPPAKK